jgi:Flp pilus assembly protein TadD
VPPTWNYNVDLVVIGNHVNAAVGMPFESETVIDFNVSDFRGHYPTRRVPDDYAVALYYTNLGAEALLHKDYAQSFVLLREALRLAPDLPQPWVDLGVLYGRQRQFAHAEAAYLRALEADPSERSALANLVGIYTALGDERLAAEYRERARRYQELNPFYHYSLGQSAYDEGRYEDALASARRAIRIKRDEPAFQTLEQRALVALGRERDAARAAPSAERGNPAAATFDAPPIRTVSGRLDAK